MRRICRRRSLPLIAVPSRQSATPWRGRGKLREQLNLLCEQSKDRYLDAGEEISALSSDLSAGLTRLSETLADIQVIFDDAENAFDELQLPEEECVFDPEQIFQAHALREPVLCIR